MECGLGQEDILHDEVELANPSRACCASGSDIAGFSPITYMPRMTPSWTASMISTVRPFSGSRSVFQNSSNLRISDFDGLTVREDHRNEAGVRRTLDVA